VPKPARGSDDVEAVAGNATPCSVAKDKDLLLLLRPWYREGAGEGHTHAEGMTGTELAVVKDFSAEWGDEVVST
jgi:hypothetical protein